jgi:ribulose 1,5-bisphosphate synthetase/thiazole synthase
MFSLTPLLAAAQTLSHAEPNVLVVGGTPAGVAAAVTAARDGQRVVLVSAKDDLGGTLTDAMMDQWDLNTTSNGTSVEHGIFDEIYARLGDVFTPQAAARTFAEMVESEPRIETLYDTQAIAVETTPQGDERRVDAVTLRNTRTEERETISAPYIIDATDNADVAVLAGARYDVGRQDSGLDERTQAVTEMFTIAGVDWNALTADYNEKRDGEGGGAIGRRAWGYTNLMRDYKPVFDDIVVRDLNLGELPDGDVTVNAIDVTGIDGLDPRQLANAKSQTEIEAPHLLAYLKPRMAGLRNARIGIFAPDVYVRETRHIAGVEELTTQDVWDGRVPSDSIGLASYPIDLHPVDPTDEDAYAPERHVYGIPFGALIPRGITHLLLASPSISASHEAAGSARTIPTTIEEGEADAIAVADDRHTFVRP